MTIIIYQSSSGLTKHSILTQTLLFKSLSNTPLILTLSDSIGISISILSYLVPNYDQMLANGQDIDLIGLVRSLGGCSNWERYEFISKLFSERIMIQNP